MDMALDDIIDEKFKKNTGPRFRGGRGVPRGGRGFRRFSNRNNDRENVQFGSYRKGEGSGGAFRRDRINKRNSKPYGDKNGNTENNEDVLNDDASLWGHDLYEKVQQGEEPSIDFPAAHGNLSLETGTKIQVSNLDYNVTEDDLKDLFQQVGDVKKVKILYDRSGRSEGSAEVFFARRGDAEDAVKKYHNVELDGKPMKINFMGSALQSNENRDSFRSFGNRGGRRGGGERAERGERGERDYGSRLRQGSSSRRSVIRRGGFRGGNRRY